MKAFIIYAPEDRRLAVRLWDELRWHGLMIGIDLQDAPPHLERSAVLEDIISQCELLVVLAGPHIPDEMRRLHALAIEQELNVIVLALAGNTLPAALRAKQRIAFGDYDSGFQELLTTIPAQMLEKTPDEDKVLANLHHTDVDVRRTNFFLVGKDRIHGALTTAMSRMLSDPAPDVRAAAAWALDQLGNVEATSALLIALTDPAYDVRSNAGWALVNIGRRRDSPASRAVTHEVIAILRDSDNTDAREMAYQVLLRLGGKDAFDAINRYGPNT